MSTSVYTFTVRTSIICSLGCLKSLDDPTVGLSNPSPGVLDFDDWRSLRAMYEAAKLAGIFVILRPGKFTHAVSPFQRTHDLLGPYVSHLGP